MEQHSLQTKAANANQNVQTRSEINDRAPAATTATATDTWLTTDRGKHDLGMLVPLPEKAAP
jgi:hypothetical protein